MLKTELRIRVVGDRFLRRRAKPVKEVTGRHREILSVMARLMYEGQGIGLASNQVGIDESMIVVDIGSGLYKLINPVIVYKEGSQENQEGCLSVPDICIKVKRAKKVKVKALNENAEPVVIEADNLFACVLQHEIDHLRGRLIIDHASFFQKMKIKNRIQRLQQRAKDEELSEPACQSCELQL